MNSLEPRFCLPATTYSLSGPRRQWRRWLLSWSWYLVTITTGRMVDIIKRLGIKHHHHLFGDLISSRSRVRNFHRFFFFFLFLCFITQFSTINESLPFFITQSFLRWIMSVGAGLRRLSHGIGQLQPLYFKALFFFFFACSNLLHFYDTWGKEIKFNGCIYVRLIAQAQDVSHKSSFALLCAMSGEEWEEVWKHISSNSKSAIIQALLVWLARMLTKLLLLRINKYRIFNRKLQYGEWSWEIGERCEWKISSQKEKKTLHIVVSRGSSTLAIKKKRSIT